MVFVDMAAAAEATTAGLARLVVLRRRLRARGRDLRLLRLHGQAAYLHELYRMSGLLPRARQKRKGDQEPSSLTGVADSGQPGPSDPRESAA